jgi:hypothetical protein
MAARVTQGLDEEHLKTLPSRTISAQAQRAAEDERCATPTPAKKHSPAKKYSPNGHVSNN